MMLRRTKIVGWMGAVLLATLATAAGAQPLRLNNVPPTTGNDRFFREAFAVRHPSLSLNGFSCAGLVPGGCDAGLGLADVLRAVYTDAPDEKIHAIYEQLLALADEPFVGRPSSRGDVLDNTYRLQARAFVALTTYVLERNGNDRTALNTRTGPDLPSHNEALRDFKEGLADGSMYRVDGDFEIDAVKWPSAVTNVARALDFYLALENAYRYYGDPDYNDAGATRLLSCFEKGAWLSEFAFSMLALDQLGTREIVPLPLISVRVDQVQPGNWPMKVFVALGYAALVQQEHDGTCYPDVRLDLPALLYRALESAAAPTDQNRAKHWHYQTEGGKRFFAEGPYYFHLALSEVLPFLHALRLNGLLNYHPEIRPGDPFRSRWLTGPLGWLADLTTPDGRLPALDDGNKIDLRDAALMRWTADYGDAALGRRMAWIADRHDGRPWGVNRDLLPLEIAIPRLDAGAGIPPPDTIGNTRADQTGEDGEQQLVLRRTTDDGMHYVLLNGESGDAIQRGEGHEQGDQMQLLYYLDAVSYLLDAGYDNANGLGNSSWNHYRDHNVMTMGLDLGNGEGGVKDPRLRIERRRIVSSHQSVDALFRTTAGRLDVLAARIELDPDDDLGVGSTSTYRRTVLFVHDPHRPFLVDLNAATGPADTRFRYAMRYHGNSDRMPRTPDRDGYARWDDLWATTSAPQRTGAALLLHPFAVEYPLKTTTSAMEVRETLNGQRPILRLDVEGGPPGDGLSADHTTVAFVRPLPPGTDRAAAEAARPVAAHTHATAGLPEGAPLAWRFFTWRHDDATLDVVAVRSAAVHRNPVLRTHASLPVRTAEGTLLVDFPAGADYGFLRLRRQNGTWTADPDYQLHLALDATQPVATEPVEQPLAFGLAPNVPNPFARTTELPFALPEATYATLVIYDLGGREVERLVDGYTAAGMHRAAWDARRLASGVYLARLTAGPRTATRQLVLRK